MIDNLMRRYFPTLAEEAAMQESEAEGQNREIHQTRIFIGCERYRTFKARLRELMKQHQPVPSSDVGAMNFQLGIQRGIELVRYELESYEDAVAEK